MSAGIPSPSSAKLASARASALRRSRAERQLVRIVGDDSGVYTLPQIGERLGVTTKAVYRLVIRQRQRGHVTWVGLRSLAQAGV